MLQTAGIRKWVNGAFTFSPDGNPLVGPIAEETLHRLNADVLFLGVDGFDVHYGLSTPNLLEAARLVGRPDIADQTASTWRSAALGPGGPRRTPRSGCTT